MTTKKPTLADLRDAARAVVHETPTDQPLRWRVVSIEYGGGIAPVCTATQYTSGNTTSATHELHTGGRDRDGLYDCCPRPWIEVWSDDMAAYLVALLNADAEQAANREQLGSALARAEAADRLPKHGPNCRCITAEAANRG